VLTISENLRKVPLGQSLYAMHVQHKYSHSLLHGDVKKNIHCKSKPNQKSSTISHSRVNFILQSKIFTSFRNQLPSRVSEL